MLLTTRSASRDVRFRPVKSREVPELHVSVSLLGDFEEAKHPEDWLVGVHGVIVEFHMDGAHFKATFLPEIAAEQGWSREETLRSLVQKSGYRGAKSLAELKGFLRVTRYTSRKATLSYPEYLVLVRPPQD